jgi:hypothetical protein
MGIQKFFIKAVAFTLLNIFLLLAVLLFFSGRNRDIQFNTKDTESNLLSTGANKHYDIGLLGTSRGRVFSRDDNHQRVENLLQKSLVNLSKGGGGGLMPAKIHLSHFYSRGNSVDHLFYLVDPWVFYSPINNENNTFFLRDEPFELSILWQLITDRYPLNTIFSYLKMIAVTDWQEISRYAGPGLTSGTLKNIDHEKIQQAKIYYQSRYKKENFKRYCQYVDTINALAKNHGSKITYIILPLLIPDFPGIEGVDHKLREVTKQQSHVSYINLSTAMQDPQYYYDHMHFNIHGIDYFSQNVLSPILEGKDVSL